MINDVSTVRNPAITLYSGVNSTGINKQDIIAEDLLKLKKFTAYLERCLRLSIEVEPNTTENSESSRPLYPWLAGFDREITKVENLSNQVFSSWRINYPRKLISCVRKIEAEFLPLILNEYCAWAGTGGELSLLAKALFENRSTIDNAFIPEAGDNDNKHLLPDLSYVEDEIPVDISGGPPNTWFLADFFSDAKRIEDLQSFTEGIQKTELAGIASTTASLIETIYGLLPPEHPKRIKIAHARVATLEKIIASLQQSKSSLKEYVDFYKSRLVAEQKIIAGYESHLLKKKSAESAVLRAKVEQVQTFNESLKSEVKHAIQAAESANAHAATYSHLPSVVSSLTEELQQTRKDFELKLNNSSNELNKAKVETHKSAKQLNTAKFNSKKNFLIGSFLGLVGAIVSLRNWQQKSINSLNAVGLTNSVIFPSPKKPENEVNPFDLSAGIPFS